MAYLKAIEEGDLKSIPSRVHLRGFLRLYAGALNVKPVELAVNDYNVMEAQYQSSEETSLEDEAGSPPVPSENETERPSSEPEPPPEPEVEPTAAEEQPPQDIPAADIPHDESGSSRLIFASIGAKLKQRRELLSLSISDVEQQIHVREHYLEAIENGHFSDLPSPVQAKGMLTNYADFLNLDSDALLLEYAEGLQQQRIERQSPKRGQRVAQEISRSRLRLKNFFSLDLLIIAGLFIGFSVFVIWGVNRILAADSPPPQTTDLPEVAEVLLATGTPTMETLTPQETTSPETDLETDSDTTPEATPIFTSAAGENPIQIVLIPRQRVWVSVTVDEEVVFEGRLIPGNAYDFSGQEKIEILTGNAAALQLYFNNQDIGPTGLIGQVTNLVFTQSGLVLPTPTHTPTITETPQITPTSTVSPTPSPSPVQEIDD